MEQERAVGQVGDGHDWSQPAFDDLAEQVRAAGERWGDGDPPASALVDAVAALERLATTVAAVQLDVVAALTARQRRDDAAAGIEQEVTDRAVASMVGLARRTSPHQGARDRELAAVLRAELPTTRRAMLEGHGSRRHAEVVARGTVFLSRAQRAVVDAEFGPHLGDLSVGRLRRRVSARAYALDPEGHVAHIARQREERHVSVRPTPDTMAVLSALLPATQAVAVWGALDRAARSLRAAGDERSLAQLRADVLTERVTGQALADGPVVELQVVVPAGAVFGGEAVLGALTDSDAPATLVGHGPIPAPMARDLVRRAQRCTLRRLLVDPESGTLVDRDARRRTFSRADRDLLVARDETCRTPWCDAPVREADHVEPWAAGGPTTPDNGQGLCQHCNQVKNHPAWDTVAQLDARGRQTSVETTTPSGHRYTSPTRRLVGA
ncbi:HNH endonuclease [Kytococcus schroeteri]|uniref:HNH endonuclease n=1 Tax=Kytococcus schroeteri TaxID=138300 RepID=UPI0015DFBE23|nr:HNH endonuclease signature motif containing protein [Kytococcus schroeteri]